MPDDNVTLHCSIEGNPFPTVTWKRVDYKGHFISVLPNFVLQHSNRTIIFENVALDDTGIYVCIAENEYSRDEKYSTVKIVGEWKYLGSQVRGNEDLASWYTWTSDLYI